MEESREETSDQLREMVEAQDARLIEETARIEDLEESVKKLKDTIAIQKVKLKEFDEYVRLTKRPEKLDFAKSHEDRINRFAENVRHRMTRMYKDVMDYCDVESDLETFDKALSRNVEHAADDIVDEFKNNQLN